MPFMGKKVNLQKKKKNKIVPIVLYIDVTQYSVIYCHRNTIHTFLNSPLYLESNVSRRWLP